MSKARRAHSVSNPLRIRVVASVAEARRAMRGGYTPVECSFGKTSVVNRLQMDHHGTLHALPGVAIRAYEQVYGACSHRPWFAVTGHPDEDATWAIGALSGLLPHPSRAGEFRNAPRPMREAWARDWTPLARLINRLDTDPTPVDLTHSRHGRLLLLWRLRGSSPLRDTAAFFAGVDRWRSLLTQATDRDLEVAPLLLESRLEAVRGLPHEKFGRHVMLVNCANFGFSTLYAWEWYERHQADVVLAFQPRPSGRGLVTVCARSLEEAERLFGPGGLMNVFPGLRPGRWGGRPIIGGSDRAAPLAWDDVRKAARALANSVDPSRA